jgi:hypothetical protein
MHLRERWVLQEAPAANTDSYRKAA